MTKKQRNRKIVTQNKRNRIINRRYSTAMKTLNKLFQQKIKSYQNDDNPELKTQIKEEILIIVKKFYSVVDKAVKKNVIHKNNAARRKSNVGKISSKL
jgi:small subunit ribosomal protein S20|uniref:30S ribosomal protein S20 n=1 Tax=Ochromonas sp. CCMP1393 TaxID=420556 RepID=A0A0D3ML20_9STRA|nr:30S ribosomal protein S20 [Ochromonas sp. CCMP1393]